MIIFAIWPDSLGRQIVGTGAVLCLLSLFLFRDKYNTFILSLLFFSQFLVSLTSFDLNPPVKLLVLFTDILLALLIGMALQRRIRLHLDGLGWLFLLLISWIAITGFYSAHPHRSLFYFLSQLKFFILYVLVRNTPITEAFARRIPPLVTAIIAIQAFIAVAQTMNGGPVGLEMIGEFVPKIDELGNYLVSGSYRSSGTIGQTNGFAGYMAMLLVFLAPFVLARRSLYLWVGFALGIIALILPLSRAGWLSFIVGFCCVLFMVFRARLVKFTRLAGFILVGGLILCLGVGFYFDTIMHRFEDRVAKQSAMGRLHQFPVAWKVIEKYPVLGIGPGVTEYFGTWNNYRIYVRKALPDVDMSNQVHNSQLQVAIETGVPGGVIFLAIMGVIFGGVLRNVKAGREKESIQLLRIGGTCAGVAIMTHVSFCTELNSIAIFLVFWILLGLARSGSSLESTKDLVQCRTLTH
jgi:hypothetical protein